MKMVGEQRIAASREEVWRALNDPDVLRECIPGCQALEKVGDDRMDAVAEVKIGPIGARFKGTVVLSELNPPNACTISGEGQGGMAGFAKGGARVRLAADGKATVLAYDVDAQVGGRLAQLGGPVIDATAKQLASKFFTRFGEIVGGSTQVGVVATDDESAQPLAPAIAQADVPAPQRRPKGPVVAWILAVALAALVGFLVGRAQPGSAGSDWVGLAIGLLLMVIFVAGFALGRRTAPPPIDYALLVRLLEGAKK